MKISYVLQMREFLIMLSCGIVLGIIYGLLKALCRITKNKIVEIITNAILTAIGTIFFIFMVNVINLGEIRAFLIIAYTLGIILERITLGKIFAKGYKSVYNILVRIIGKFKNSNIGKVILK